MGILSRSAFNLMPAKPSIFVGSSAEGLEVARALTTELGTACYPIRQLIRNTSLQPAAQAVAGAATPLTVTTAGASGVSGLPPPPLLRPPVCQSPPFPMGSTVSEAKITGVST